MSDVLLVVIMLVFFGLAVLFVNACDRIIGPDEDVTSAASEETVSV